MTLAQLQADEVDHSPSRLAIVDTQAGAADMADVRGQENVKRALEIAASGGHHILLCGPPGCGKTMLLERFSALLPTVPSVLRYPTYIVAPKLDPDPFKDHELWLLDEWTRFHPHFFRQLLYALDVHRGQLAAAMNPCRCGLGGPGRGACGKAPACQRDFQASITGQILDRIDVQVDVPPVAAADLALPMSADTSARLARRVRDVHQIQRDRARASHSGAPDTLNAHLAASALEAALDAPARTLLARAAEAGGLTGRGWTRTLRLARTIADMDGSEALRRLHIAEALIYRHAGPTADFGGLA